MHLADCLQVRCLKLQLGNALQQIECLEREGRERRIASTDSECTDVLDSPAFASTATLLPLAEGEEHETSRPAQLCRLHLREVTVGEAKPRFEFQVAGPFPCTAYV